LAFAFTLPLSRAAVTLFIILFPIIWLLEGNFKNKFLQIKASKLLLVTTSFLIFEFLSITWSTDTQQALAAARMYTYWFAIFVLATSIKKEWVNKIITFFLYGMVISEVFAYLIFFDIYAIKGQAPDYPSPFMMHIDYSIFLAFTSILLLNRIFSNRYTRSEKIVMFIFFATVTTNLFISTGRTGQ
jgi:O-antigen ligase